MASFGERKASPRSQATRLLLRIDKAPRKFSGPPVSLFAAKQALLGYSVLDSEGEPRLKGMSGGAGGLPSPTHGAGCSSSDSDSEMGAPENCTRAIDRRFSDTSDSNSSPLHGSDDLVRRFSGGGSPILRSGCVGGNIRSGVAEHLRPMRGVLPPRSPRGSPRGSPQGKGFLRSMFSLPNKRKNSDLIGHRRFSVDDGSFLLGEEQSSWAWRHGRRLKRTCTRCCGLFAVACWAFVLLLLLMMQRRSSVGSVSSTPVLPRPGDFNSREVRKAMVQSGRQERAGRLKHLGLMPTVPEALREGSAWEDMEDDTYCEHSEPRFNAQCTLLLTWGARRASMARVLNATAQWLQGQHIEYTTVFSTLLAAVTNEPKLVMSQPCQVAVHRTGYERMKMLLTAGHLKLGRDTESAKRQVEHASYGYKVLEDQPWDDRSTIFPKFDGEWWAPLDESGGVAGAGLLYKPQQPCSPMRFIDSKTGLYCEAIVLENDGSAGANWFLRWPGGPKPCPSFLMRSREHSMPCESDGCYQLHAAHMSPHMPCPPLLGVTLRCPRDAADSLRGCYASQVAGVLKRVLTMSERGSAEEALQRGGVAPLWEGEAVGTVERQVVGTGSRKGGTKAGVVRPEFERLDALFDDANPS